jgi:hypothetical protein
MKMSKQSATTRLAGVLSAASGFWLAFGGSAVAQVPTPEVTIMIFAEHYVVEGRSIDDLDVLEAAVDSVRPQAVGLYACGAGTARAQRAAAHRFRNLDMELRVLDQNSPGCQSTTGPRAVPANLRLDPRPSGIDDAEVDHWWHQLMP